MEFLCRVYADAYHHGHHDTVEGGYVDVLPVDRDTYWREKVEEDYAEELAQQPAACPHCDDTGDVHRADGEWRGRCTCLAGQQPAADDVDAEQFRKGWQAGFAEGRRDQRPAAVDEAMVERAFDAWCDVADVDEWRVRNAPEALRAALTAALAPQPPAEAQPDGDVGEFGVGIQPNPKARYWQERAEFWKAQAVALGWREKRDAANGEAPPSTPVGGGSIEPDDAPAMPGSWFLADAYAAGWNDALAQQPAAVDEAMVRKVAKAINAEMEGTDDVGGAWKRLGSNERRLRDRMARAALALQGGDT